MTSEILSYLLTILLAAILNPWIIFNWFIGFISSMAIIALIEYFGK